MRLIPVGMCVTKQQKDTPRSAFRSARWLALCLLIAQALAAAVVVVPSSAVGQGRRGDPTASPTKKSLAGRARDKGKASGGDVKLLAEATTAACHERERDPLGSVPIDVLQARPSLPLRHREVEEGVKRAGRLLPVAKKLTAESLRTLAREVRLGRAALEAALGRVRRVESITPDVELRDNASVVFSEPRSVRFGTLFLVGLNSDEALIGVLAHELTHVADGPHGQLAPIFRALSRRAVRAAGLRLSAQRAEELACDLVGVMAVRAYIVETPAAVGETLARRASRAVGHNCVVHDSTDAAHLSPRGTLRALLALEPALAREIAGPGVDTPAAAPSAGRKVTTHHPSRRRR
ncbi:MAG: hypothetical protein ACRD9R_22645 [Pyrinomonadaceae bacterium]